MRKIIIFGVLLMLCANIPAFSACNIGKLEACKADIGSGINDKLQDKILPNNLDQLKQPNNTFNNRTQQGQTNLPENLNTQPAQESRSEPYDANCQFGNCFNRTNSNERRN